MPNQIPEIDVGIGDGNALTPSTVAAGMQVFVKSITLSPIASASGEQCGHVTLRDGTTALWRAYVFFTATAANQSLTLTFPVNAAFKVVTDLNLLYTAVTDATTASVSMAWGS
jgi:hypothetical protein